MYIAHNLEVSEIPEVPENHEVPQSTETGLSCPGCALRAPKSVCEKVNHGRRKLARARIDGLQLACIHQLRPVGDPRTRFPAWPLPRDPNTP